MKNILPFDHISNRYHANLLEHINTFYEFQANDANSCNSQAAIGLRKLITDAIGRKGNYATVLSGKFSAVDEIIKEWASIPAFYRNSVENSRNSIVNDISSNFITYIEKTNGSTGKPFTVIRSSHSIQREFLRLRYIIRYYASRLSLPLPSQIFYLSDYPNAQSYHHIELTSSPLLIEKLALKSADALERRFSSLRGSMPFIVAATPSTLFRLLEHGTTITREALSMATFIFSSGEHLPQEIHGKLNSVVRPPIIEIYVMREFGLIGFSCTNHEGFHIFHNDLYTTSSKNNEILISDSTNAADLYINYYTGDRGVLSKSHTCSCGTALPLLRDFIGRPFGKPFYQPPEYEGRT